MDIILCNYPPPQSSANLWAITSEFCELGDLILLIRVMLCQSCTINPTARKKFIPFFEYFSKFRYNRCKHLHCYSERNEWNSWNLVKFLVVRKSSNIQMIQTPLIMTENWKLSNYYFIDKLKKFVTWLIEQSKYLLSRSFIIIIINWEVDSWITKTKLNEIFVSLSLVRLCHQLVKILLYEVIDEQFKTSS